MHLHWYHVVHAYAQYVLRECRCGSRRTVYRHSRGYSALMWGWPPPDGKAHPEPDGGWPTGPPPLPRLPYGPGPGGAKK